MSIVMKVCLIVVGLAPFPLRSRAKRSLMIDVFFFLLEAISFVAGTLFASTTMRSPSTKIAHQTVTERTSQLHAEQDLIAAASNTHGHQSSVLGSALVANPTAEEVGSVKVARLESIGVDSAGGEGQDWNVDSVAKFMLPRSQGEDPLSYVGKNRKLLGKKAWADEFMNRSTDVALRDGRALVICPYALQHAGHGNAHFVAAGMTALAYRFNLLPVIPCKKNGKLNTSPFQNFHCVNEKIVKWKGISDGGGVTDITYQARVEKLAREKALGGPNIFINGYFQYWHGMSYAQDAVCWAFRPNVETQTEVRAYFESVVLKNLTGKLRNTSQIVAVHVRRGDYVNKNKVELHGALSIQYYSDAWRMLHARIRLGAGTEAANNVVVLVFAADNSLQWAREHLKFPGARIVQFVNPNQKGRGPAADIDMLALSLADYFILANSTFCWWAHFYSECRRRFRSWWQLPWQHPRGKTIEPLFTLPHRWHKFRDKGLPDTYTFMQGGYLIPRTKSLFEEYEGFTNENGTAVGDQKSSGDKSRRRRKRGK